MAKFSPRTALSSKTATCTSKYSEPTKKVVLFCFVFSQFSQTGLCAKQFSVYLNKRVFLMTRFYLFVYLYIYIFVLDSSLFGTSTIVFGLNPFEHERTQRVPSIHVLSRNINVVNHLYFHVSNRPNLI